MVDFLGGSRDRRIAYRTLAAGGAVVVPLGTASRRMQNLPPARRASDRGIVCMYVMGDLSRCRPIVANGRKCMTGRAPASAGAGGQDPACSAVSHGITYLA